MLSGEDRDLGMARPINRRDFIQGVAAAGATLAMTSGAMAQETSHLESDVSNNYPPLRTGMRGMHPGAFEAAHALRDGAPQPVPVSTGETYDLVVVGAGLSGLSAAWYYRQAAGPSARILVLDNHDDFGGHAKRNEFVFNGRKLVATGGSAYMVAPRSWTRDAIGLIDALGIDWRAGKQRHSGAAKAAGLHPGVFFNEAVYGRDILVQDGNLMKPTHEFLARTPLPPALQSEIFRLTHGTTDYLPGLTVDQKIERLRSISYRTYLLDVAKFSPEILSFTQGVWCLGNDMASAWLALFRGKPGFAGLGLSIPQGSPENPKEEAEDFILPAGNSDIARLIVRSLIPDALVAGSWESVEGARVDYGTLDRTGSPTRIRLSSIVVNARHLGPKPHQFEPDGREVAVSYMQGGKCWSVKAQNVVMAGMNNMIPYICPDIPGSQATALHTAVRACNQATNVLFRNWEAFAKLKTGGIICPNAFYGSILPELHSTVGSVQGVHDPSQPVIVSFATAANSGIAANPTMMSELLHGAVPPPGTAMDDQFRAIRAGLLQAPFSQFERAVRKQAAGALAGGGFDPARDILAITVNRWPHGFATGRNVLFDHTGPDDLSPTIIAKQKFGRIAIANSDSSGIGIAQTAIDEGCRAVRDLQPRVYGYYETV